jgi:pimeloyl-ACP methyl ester carboxylesterase
MGRGYQFAVKYGTFVKINDLNIHVWEAGSGMPVVLLHGFMGMAYDWRFNIQELGRQFAVYALDLPGFGYSDKQLDFEYTSDSYAEFICAYLNSRNIDRAVLVGNSMGGQIALQACLKYPDRVSGLVLIDSGGYPHSVGFPLFKLLKVPLLGELSMMLVNRAVIRIMLREGIFHDGSFATDEAVGNYYDVYRTVNARKIPPIVIREIMKDEAHIASNLNNIRCPTLIIWGAEDKVISPSRAEMFKSDIENASALIISRAGHMPQVEKSKTVNDAVIGFLITLTSGV